MINFDTGTNNGIGGNPGAGPRRESHAKRVFGFSPVNKDMAYLQAGFQPGGLYQYAPNVNVLHCPSDQRANSGQVGNPAGNDFCLG